MGFSIGSLPIRYLGVPLISTKLKASDCEELEDRILKRIKTWTNKFLSFAGRLQLIQSILFSIQTFWCSHFIIPSKVSKAMESLLSAFLWKGVSMEHQGAKVSWEEISKPKKEGGLGVKKVKDWNLASMSRYIWQICQPTSSSLWVSWIKMNLLHKNHFWVAKIPWNCSWTWRKILKLRDKIKPYISMDVGDGRHTSLWFDSWMPRRPICSSPNARVIYDSGLPKDAKVNAIISLNNWSWPVANSHELIELKEETLLLAPPNMARMDLVVWNKIRGGEYSTKAAWELLRSHSPAVSWSHLVWFKYYIPRHSFILCLAIKERLTTQDRLCSFGLAQSMQCYLCDEKIEDHNHLFFGCVYSFRIWHAIMTKCSFHATSPSWAAVRHWACTTFKGTSLLSIIGRLSFASVVYVIWAERNARKHGRTRKNELSLIRMIEDLVGMRLLGCSGFPRNSTNLHLVQAWKLHPSLIYGS